MQCSSKVQGGADGTSQFTGSYGKTPGFPWFSKENHLEIGYNWWVFIDLVRYHRITGLGVRLGGPEI